VLDMRLPGVGGAEFYAALPRPRPPAVFITAHDGPAAQRSARRVGGQACLGKPFDGTEFLEIVGRAVQGGDVAA
jgi:FixJ family two-component response regulator